jgi:VWFA-related protein
MVKATDAVKAAARTFVDAVRTEDSLSVVTFADAALTEHDLTRDRSPARDAIEGYTARGGTALYDALCDALLRLEKAQGRKVVVALTDGRDENNPGTAPGSVRTADDVAVLMRRSGAAIFTIGLGPKVDAALLERLASDSGGESYFPEDVSTLRQEYDRIVENLRRRYVVSYDSTNPARNGEWRNVEIRSAIPDTVVRSAGGYFAPER